MSFIPRKPVLPKISHHNEIDTNQKLRHQSVKELYINERVDIGVEIAASFTNLNDFSSKITIKFGSVSALTKTILKE